MGHVMEKEMKFSEKQLMECPHCQKTFNVSVRVEAAVAKETVLPASDKGRPAQRSGVRPHASPLSLDYKKVVVAVEGDGTREVIKELLEGSRFDVIDASSSDDLFSVLEQCYPATVLVDFGISKMTLMSIEEAIDKAALIVVSAGYGKSNVYSEEHASLLGADDYIERRHIKRDLINKVKLHLRQKGFKESEETWVGDQQGQGAGNLAVVLPEVLPSDIVESPSSQELHPLPDDAEGPVVPIYEMGETDSTLTVEPLSDAEISELSDTSVLSEMPILEQEPIVYAIEETASVLDEIDQVVDIAAVAPPAEVVPPPEAVAPPLEYDWGITPLAPVGEVEPLSDAAISDLTYPPVLEEIPVVEEEPIAYAIEETPPTLDEMDQVIDIAAVAPPAEVVPPAEVAPLEVEYEWGMTPSVEEVEPLSDAAISDLTYPPVLEEMPVVEEEPIAYAIEETPPTLDEMDQVIDIAEVVPPAEVAPLEVEYDWGMTPSPTLEQEPTEPVYDMEETGSVLIEEPVVERDADQEASVSPPEDVAPTDSIVPIETNGSGPFAPVGDAPLTGAGHLIEERALEMNAYIPAMEELNEALTIPVIPEQPEAIIPIPPALPTIDIDPKELELAKRLARIIVSDIVLYNENKVVEGIRNNTFYALLKDDISEGRKHYNSRVSTTIQESGDYLLDAFETFIKKKKVKTG